EERGDDDENTGDDRHEPPAIRHLLQPVHESLSFTSKIPMPGAPGDDLNLRAPRSGLHDGGQTAAHPPRTSWFEPDRPSKDLPPGHTRAPPSTRGVSTAARHRPRGWAGLWISVGGSAVSAGQNAESVAL